MSMTSDNRFARAMESANDLLRERLGRDIFDSYIKIMRFGGYEDGVVTLYFPTVFFRDFVARNYGDEIKRAWRDCEPDVTETVLKVGSARPDAENRDGEVVRDEAIVSREENSPVSDPLDPRFTFDTFVVGEPNQFAYAAARKIAESSQIAFNPLYLYSGAGLGKTHLMHSIAWYIREHDPHRTAAYLSAERFMRRFVGALRHKDTYSFKEQFRDVDVLLIDDVQFLIGKESTQIEFFHVFNDLVGRGKQIVLSADKPPVNLDGIEERLKTRLGGGIVADIHPTTYELRLGILEKQAETLGIAVPTEVLEFLAEKITASVRELGGALLRVAAHVDLMGGEVTLERTRDILRDVLSAVDRSVTVDEILRKVAERYNLRTAEMMSKRRDRSIARPRQIAMYLAKVLTTKSLPEIGRAFDRDHTTVIHAVKKVEELCETDAAFKDEIDALRRGLSF